MKRAGISLALVVMLLLGAAAPVQAQAEETGLAAEAESFYRSVLAAKDRETLQPIWTAFRTSAGWNCGQSSPQRCGRGWILFCSR